VNEFCIEQDLTPQHETNMKYTIHENGWTVILEDFDFNTATQDDINQIAKLVAKYTLVVARGQKLSILDELRVCNMFKNPEPLFNPGDEKFLNSAADLVNDPAGILCRVTGEVNETGLPGIAAHEDEMVWHNNHPFRADRRPIVWLYSVRGSVGSRTSYNNTILAYNDLDQERKDKLKDLKQVYYGGHSLAEGFEDHEWFEDDKFVKEDFTPPLVYTNIANQTGLYLSPYQLEKFVGMTTEETQEVVTPLFEFVVQDKYCYHHDWEDGDVVIAEQWLGIHKRWKFEKITQRLLHRAAFDFPDQDYS
jgi:alpha-ketoglutarate-dependent taurine dioxygenase